MTVSISGASGYLGNALLQHLKKQQNYFIHVIRHSSPSNLDSFYGKETCASLLNPSSLSGWPSPESSVVHLAYMWDASREDNLRATHNLVNACAKARIKRLVHVSTTAVIGRAHTDWVDEQTPCHPITPYGVIKLEIEKIIRESAQRYGFDCVILRPTSIYGPEGAPLKKLVEDLCHSPWPKNYLKASLFGRRAMNLVHVDNAVAGLLFLLNRHGSFNGDTFILSEDSNPGNNFLNVENVIRTELGLAPYPLPILPMPNTLLSLILRMMRRNIVNPNCRFRSDHIESKGFTRVLSLKEGLIDYLRWYKTEVVGKIHTHIQNHPL